MIKLDLQSRTPIYMQLKQRISELILLGEFATDAPLPSVRALARELGINPNTIQKAYQELESAGVIYSVAGKGSFAAGQQHAQSFMAHSVRQRLEAALGEARMAGFSRIQLLQIVDAVYPTDKEEAQ